MDRNHNGGVSRGNLVRMSILVTGLERESKVIGKVPGLFHRCRIVRKIRLGKDAGNGQGLESVMLEKRLRVGTAIEVHCSTFPHDRSLFKDHKVVHVNRDLGVMVG